MVIGIQYRDVLRADDLGRYHLVSKLSTKGCEYDDIVGTNVFQWPEERVAVRGNSDVSNLSGHRSPWNVPGGAAKRWLVGSFNDNNRDAEPCNLDAADQAVGTDRAGGSDCGKHRDFGWRRRDILLPAQYGVQALRFTTLK